MRTRYLPDWALVTEWRGRRSRRRERREEEEEEREEEGEEEGEEEEGGEEKGNKMTRRKVANCKKNLVQYLKTMTMNAVQYLPN